MKKLNSRQLKFRQSFLKKLENGKYRLVSLPCPCGRSEDIGISEIDARGIPLKVVLCKGCGLMRADPYYTESTLRDFYNFEYRGLYETKPKVDNVFFERD